jgi:hypothetical protein
MATSTNDQQITKRRTDLWGGSVGNFGNLGVAVRNPSQSGYVVVVILLILLVCLLLPLMAMLYFDSLKCQKKAESTEVRVEKLLKNLEEKDKK